MRRYELHIILGVMLILTLTAGLHFFLGGDAPEVRGGIKSPRWVSTRGSIFGFFVLIDLLLAGGIYKGWRTRRGAPRPDSQPVDAA